jgi:hypothetical protein
MTVHHHEWTHGDAKYHWAHEGSMESCAGLSITVNDGPIPVTGECPDGECPGYSEATVYPE